MPNYEVGYDVIERNYETIIASNAEESSMLVKIRVEQQGLETRNYKAKRLEY